MLDPDSPFPPDPLGLARPRDWVPLRTLTVLRWVAIAGQVAALVVATQVIELEIATGAASLAIGASVLVNLVAALTAPRTRRLTEREATLFLTFDILQLGLLLALTGGLNNPFAVLLLAPVTIAASILHTRSTLVLGGLTLAVITAIGPWHVPVVTADGPLETPRLFLWGFWVALAIGVGFLGFYARQVTAEMTAMSEALTATQLALHRAQRLSDLDGVVAAAAHELGTPLATIKLVSGEMMEELGDRPDLADLREDAELLHAQADRCRDILRAMGRAGRRDSYLDRAPFEAVLREAAEPHLDRGKAVEIVVAEGRQPEIPRRPEIVHGLRNLVQNAVDFARSRVEIRLDWTPERLSVRIRDDGPGFEPALLDRIGDPFMRGRPGARPQETGPAERPGYEGMGLGLFIAKSLLERTGARLTFANDAAGGAVAVVAWPRSAVAPGEGAEHAHLS
ncbi:Sensor histidine kinase PrrB (RegB) [Rubellimicrobium mesophilum DSM 19309]|uniref:histidine kinase n=1 Tax=Rubellimicrobium mesophilum DSM 19309 TaxID=442562 RepID=A0A017HJ56_9RHOB|nr:ActS/PrrB/RegB family redox-sensitive histidine kinase [Rubellimicrobium mesophilum]EYD74178.1 Sensor histidine kinase PrrB (RegB) [Rubellimicrobium mesophilum DSM 19309]